MPPMLSIRRRSLSGLIPRVAAFLSVTLVATTCSDSTAPGALKIAEIRMLRDSTQRAAGDSVRIGILVLGRDGTDLGPSAVQWLTRNSAVATVSRDGVVSALHSGRTWVVARSSGLADSTAIVVLPRYEVTFPVRSATLTSSTPTTSTGICISSSSVATRPSFYKDRAKPNCANSGQNLLNLNGFVGEASTQS